MFINGWSHNPRLNHGQAIADGVAALYVLLIALVFPMICLATMGYRTMTAYFVTRDSCYQASKSTTFTNAQSNASTAFTNDMNTFTGLNPNTSTETLYIITQPLAGGAESTTTSKLNSVNTSSNLYFIRAVSTMTINPIIKVGSSWLKITVPGLTGSFTVTFSCQDYAENPQGLTN